MSNPHLPVEPSMGMRRRALTMVAVMALAAPALAQSQELRIGGTGGALATMQLLADAYVKQQPGAKITVLRSLGSTGGIKAVISGTIQLAVSARPLKDAEIQKGASQELLGRTPFVFAIARSNPVEMLTLAQLVDIYSGRQDQWPDGQKIRLVLRPIGDSDSEMIKSISSEMRAAKTAAEQRKGMPFAVTDQDAADTMEKIPGALGASTLAQLLTEQRGLKPLRIDNVEPSVANVANGRYRWFKPLYLISGAKTSPAARQFAAFARSSHGQRILQLHGYALN